MLSPVATIETPWWERGRWERESRHVIRSARHKYKRTKRKPVTRTKAICCEMDWYRGELKLEAGRLLGLCVTGTGMICTRFKPTGRPIEIREAGPIEIVALEERLNVSPGKLGARILNSGKWGRADGENGGTR